MEDDDSTPAPDSESEALRELRQAEEELAAAEAAHWQAEFELADAEGPWRLLTTRLSSLDTQRIEARRDKVTAQRYLAEAQSRQRDAVNALAEARRRLDAARTRRAKTSSKSGLPPGTATLESSRRAVYSADPMSPFEVLR